MKTFPTLSNEKMRQRLAPPSGPVRLVIDTDAKNEIDDQFALTWALLSQEQLELEGIYAAPFSFAHHREELLRAHDLLSSKAPIAEEDRALVKQYASWVEGLNGVGTDPRDVPFPGPAEGMESSYEEILVVFEKLGLDPKDLVLRGSPGYLTSLDAPIRSPATEHLIERALAQDDRPLYVAAIGCITNVASALLLEPSIVERIVVLWTSAYPSWSHLPNASSLNLVQDKLAAKLLFDCGVPHVYLPGYYIGEQLKISLPEVERWVKGKGAIGDYLYWLYTHNPIHAQRGISGHFGRTWVIWDLIDIAWLLNPEWVPSGLVPSPVLSDDTTWRRQAGRHLMREAHGINRDAIFRDLFDKLERAA